MKYLLWLIVFVLAGCAGTSLKRDIDVQGNLPRALGLGAFASTCIIICIVTAHFEHGSVLTPDDDGDGGELVINGKTDLHLKGKKP